MGFFSSIYKPQKPRGFNMRTRYYDKQKENRELRRAIVLQKIKLENNEELPKGIFFSDLHRKFKESKTYYKKKTKHEALKTLIMVGFLLFVGSYIILLL